MRIVGIINLYLIVRQLVILKLLGYTNFDSKFTTTSTIIIMHVKAILASISSVEEPLFEMPKFVAF